MIGTVTGPATATPTACLRILDGCDGEVLGRHPAPRRSHDDAPLYHRPAAPTRRRRRGRRVPAAERPLPVSADAGAELLELLADTRWVWSQYDHQLFLNTVEGPGGDAAVLRLKHPTTGVDTGRGLALTTDGNHRWCAVDPRAGTALIVAESVLNLACVGARPLALVNCLNFGNPEHPEVMWQLSEADRRHVRGLPRLRHPRHRRQRQPLQRVAAAPTSTPPRWSACSASSTSSTAGLPGVGLVDGGRLLLVGVDPARGLRLALGP